MSGGVLPRWGTMLLVAVFAMSGCGSEQDGPGPASDLPPCSPSDAAPTTEPEDLPDDGPGCDSGGHTTVTTEGPSKQPVAPTSASTTDASDPSGGGTGAPVTTPTPPSKEPVSPAPGATGTAAGDLPPCSPSGAAPTTEPEGLPDDGTACDSGGHTTVTTEGPPKQPVAP